MKKVILLTACTAAVLLSGCSDNELASVGDGIGTSTQSAIGFHVVGNQAETRATIIDASNITSTDFNVYAFTNDGKAFMGTNDTEAGHNGINISYKGVEGSKKWDYTTPSELRYWPESTTPLNFYAVNPGTFKEDYMPQYGWKFNSNEQKISYTCFDEFGTSKLANIDVMYAIAPNQTKAQNNGTVKFIFKHILSQVVFKAKTQLENMEVEINEIKIHNSQMGGTYTLPTESTTEGTWALTVPKSGSNWKTFTVVTGQTIKVNSTSKDISVNTPMLFVPQKLTAWQTNATTAKTQTEADAAHESYLGITCKIKQGDVYLFGDDSNYKTLYVPFGTTWEQGKRYTYTLIFGGGYDENGKPILQPINFEAKAEDWTEATGNSNNDNNVNL